MAKRDEYNPDYKKLYPGENLTPEVLKVLQQSDRKMKYMEIEIKRGAFRQDVYAQNAAFTPTREDSLDRLINEEKVIFVSDEPSPEELALHNDEITRLYRALDMLLPEERGLIYALFFEGRTEKELAGRLGLTQQGVSWRLNLILKKLKNLME